MPVRKGATEIRGNVDETLAAQFEAMAAKSSKSEVMGKALEGLFNGNGSSGMAGALKAMAAQQASTEELYRTITQMQAQIANMDTHLQQIRFKVEDMHGAVAHIWDDHQADIKARHQSRLRRIFSILFER